MGAFLEFNQVRKVKKKFNIEDFKKSFEKEQVKPKKKISE